MKQIKENKEKERKVGQHMKSPEVQQKMNAAMAEVARKEREKLMKKMKG